MMQKFGCQGDCLNHVAMQPSSQDFMQCWSFHWGSMSFRMDVMGAHCRRMCRCPNEWIKHPPGVPEFLPRWRMQSRLWPSDEPR